METVFDHKPTQRELQELFTVPIAQGDYIPADEVTETGRLYRLFKLRGDADHAESYLNRIQDPDYRRDVALIDTL